jgi:hypothetical protein
MNTVTLLSTGDQLEIEAKTLKSAMSEASRFAKNNNCSVVLEFSSEVWGLEIVELDAGEKPIWKTWERL